MSEGRRIKVPPRVRRAAERLESGGELFVATVSKDGDVGWTAYDLNTGEGRDASADVDRIIDNAD